MSSGFYKKRVVHVVVVRNSDSKVIATFAWPYRGWERDNFISAMRSAKIGAVVSEVSNMPVWCRWGAAEPCTIWVIVGHREGPVVNTVFIASAWGSKPELVSMARWPIRDVAAGTYNLTMLFDGATTVTVDVPLDAAPTVGGTGTGNLADVVRALNNNVAFNVLAEAFSIGFGEASRLGIRTLTGGMGRSIEIVAGGASDASALLGFSPANENMREFGIDAVNCGTFNQQSDIKATTGT